VGGNPHPARGPLRSQVGETAAVRLHATELLMLLGTAIVLTVERPVQATLEIDESSAPLRGA
jgi:hypothetical protein